MPQIPPQPTPAAGGHKSAELLHGADPVYPEVAKAAELEGVVVLRGIIGVDGQVHDIVPLRSDHKVLTQPAIDAWKKYRYTPAQRNGVLVEEPITKPFQFKLR